MANTRPKPTTKKKTTTKTARKKQTSTKAASKAKASSKTRASSKPKTTAKAKAVQQSDHSEASYQADIILLLIFGASILMLISEWGKGGIVGNAISTYLFGLFGGMAYIFPVLLLLTTIFVIANKGNRLLKKKFVSILVLSCSICGFLQHITDGYDASFTLLDYFHRSAEYHSGGGLLGGAICISTISAFGFYGSYVILIMTFLICLILITQKSFVVFLDRLYMRIYELIQNALPTEQDLLEKQERKREQKEKAEYDLLQKKIKELNRELEEVDEEIEEKTIFPKRKTKQKPKKDIFEEEMTFAEPEQETPVSSKFSVPFRIQRSEEIPMFSEEEPTDGEIFNPFEQEESAPAKEEEIFPVQRQTHKKPKSSAQEIESGIQNVAEEIEKKETVIPASKYHYPPLKILTKGKGKTHGDSDEHLRETAQKLEDTLRNFGVNVTVTNVSCGPTVTQYELQPEMGVKVSRITALTDDIKLNLATPDIRIEAPIPGKAAIGIEVPNKENSPVMLRDLLQSQEFQNASSRLSFAVGKDISGKTVVADIAKMPHLLIAGSTGSGKSVCINTLITSILYKASPDEVKMIMIDPKVVELSVYNGIPHLLIPVVTDPKKAAGALNWAVQEMTRRYNTFAEFNVRKLEEYNHKVETMPVPEGETRPEKMTQILVIVDELADLMMVAPGEVEDAIVRLTQLARAAGIHLVIATQRPSVNVITGLIKANMPSRIAFAVSSGVDSRVILDSNGAEKLLGKGDMLFYPQGYPKPARLQGAFISDDEVSSIVQFLSSKNPTVAYNSKIEAQVNTSIAMAGAGGGSADRDVYFEEAGRFIIEKDKASIGMLQRMFKIGFNRAARIMDQLSDAGVVGPEEGTKPRKILMSESAFEAYLEEH